MYGPNDVNCEECVWSTQAQETIVCSYFGAEECDPFGQCRTFELLTDEIKSERWAKDVQDELWQSWAGRHIDIDTLPQKVLRLEKTCAPDYAADVIARYVRYSNFSHAKAAEQSAANDKTRAL